MAEWRESPPEGKTPERSNGTKGSHIRRARQTYHIKDLVTALSNNEDSPAHHTPERWERRERRAFPELQIITITSSTIAGRRRPSCFATLQLHPHVSQTLQETPREECARLSALPSRRY